MTSEFPTSAFVWVWLPGADEPLVAGRLDRRDDRHVFSYGRSYLARSDAVAIYLPELPLDSFEHDPLDGPMPLCLDDAAPDSWGRSVINAKLGVPGADLAPLVYLLESGSDRLGAIDFQASATEYVPRAPVHAPLEQLVHAADLIDAGEAIDPDLAEALTRGTPLGGARPKALVDGGGVPMLAKLSRLGDTFRWTQSEYVAMELARRAGLDVAPVQYVESLGRGVRSCEPQPCTTSPRSKRRRSPTIRAVAERLSAVAASRSAMPRRPSQRHEVHRGSRSGCQTFDVNELLAAIVGGALAIAGGIAGAYFTRNEQRRTRRSDAHLAANAHAIASLQQVVRATITSPTSTCHRGVTFRCGTRLTNVSCVLPTSGRSPTGTLRCTACCWWRGSRSPSEHVVPERRLRTMGKDQSSMGVDRCRC